MENQGRKATDVLLSLEAKVDTLISMIRSYDLNQKIMSNKLNSILQIISDNKTSNAPQVTIEAIMNHEDNRKIPISSEHAIPVETNPIGFRRTSRPETYENTPVPTKKQTLTPPPTEAVARVPSQAISPKIEENEFTDFDEKRGSIPVQQRVVDKNGKSIFLADVEIFTDKGEFVTKTRTNGAGKWQAPLAVGVYRVVIQKLESLTKERVKLEQQINIDGRTSVVDLQIVTIK